MVTDDELHLGVFRTADSEPGHLIRLFDGALPILKNRIAKSKSPTLKLSRCFLISGITLMVRSWRSVPVPGAIAAWALCSDWTRKAQCAVHRTLSTFRLFLLRSTNEFPALNIEGAVVSGDELRLFQRGNRRHAENAVIRFQLSVLLDTLSSERASAIKPSAINRYDLGHVDEFHSASPTRRRCRMAPWYSPPSQRIPTTPTTTQR